MRSLAKSSRTVRLKKMKKYAGEMKRKRTITTKLGYHLLKTCQIINSNKKQDNQEPKIRQSQEETDNLADYMRIGMSISEAREAFKGRSKWRNLDRRSGRAKERKTMEQ